MAGVKAGLYLQSSVSALRGVGPALVSRLQHMDLWRVQDVLFHLPSRYQDRRHIASMATLQAGQERAILGEIVRVDHQRGGREQWLVTVSDGSGCLQIRLFHMALALRAQWQVGRRLWCFGELRGGFHGLEMIHPEWQMADVPQFQAPHHLTPFYPSSEGITQAQWRRWIAHALTLLDQLPDYLENRLPPQWPGLREGLRLLHESADEIPSPQHPAWQRLALEELLANHLAVRRMRQSGMMQNAPCLRSKGQMWQRFLAHLPFSPTMAQERVIAEINADLARHRPMRRLLQGDVGSGKTLVAAAATLTALEAGYQVAMMAPTEILAEQLHARFQQWLEPLGLEVGYLVGSRSPRVRRETAEALAGGRLSLVIGTQSLFQEGVAFACLGLVIIDEQHRFGVEQRRQLLEKGAMPHLLVMTATPIPRTLAMTVHADLEVSVIDALPPGRTPVETLVMPDSRRPELIGRMQHMLEAGRQIYWVCPLIEESEILELQAAEASVADLQAALPGVAVGLIHGRMRSAEKAEVMAAFQSGAVRILVATTVIEVGVDVPGASLMIIEHAERLGLAQLHQLRGRVGRGAQRSSCILLYHPPLSGKARERLRVMRETYDGFSIARKDLELRGPGEYLGTRQAGILQMRVANILRDEALLAMVPALAERLLQEDPEAVQAIVQRWLGNRVDYGQVG
ncbi:ATP-dependent DNA helicase RecG [Acidithiobacillus sp. 'AMD consortium']|uniref:ATP-dependent DNA helicase RecG n=2 Tax=Acidithiobacillus ferridurans TaxID=1232575 RepID=RECG_ACIFI|nr:MULTISPECIES: ATP-dependent DNA helicase RecG [Acidithiobacillus]MBU2717167.1 ATP-dependent DNA helicase RecG [Acidithiobacillus ferridurans]MBU2726034.1 ATP-dependent DNA helicase RecG [Acidithiobacillus ferridurans]QFG77738.1 ATP-dependent DNA helicase RecG [Acidithiobacillus sp. 'AMD consortium']BBF65575.1 ATP-dependent DNA helicase RecG [Acidithiobacillus ferridurans]